MARSVLLCTDGTYPHHHGGVSVWCDQLIRTLSDVEFRVFALTGAPNRKTVFSIPSNVRQIVEVPLWGTHEPGFAEGGFWTMWQKKRRTRDEAEERFLPLFARAVEGLLHPGSPVLSDPDSLAQALLDLHLYFTQFDYSRSMSSPLAWQTFQETCGLTFGEQMTIDDLITMKRWMQRLLGLLAAPLPETSVTHTSIAGLAGVAGTLAKKLRGTPFLITEHGVYLRELYLSLMRSGFSEVCRRFLATFYGSLVRMNYYFSDSITALGAFNKGWQVRVGAPESRVVIAPNGTDPSRFYPATKIADRPPVVGTLARIYYIKGIEFMVRAAAIVHQQMPEVQFRIYGEPADKKYYERCRQIAREGGLEGVLTWSVTDKPAEVLREMDVFCLSSLSEGMPYSVLEAMFSGVAVVASDVGNVADMLNGTGVLVPPADPEALAEGLLSVVRDGAYRESLTRAALERARSIYTTEQAINRFRGLYETLLDSRKDTRLHQAAN